MSGRSTRGTKTYGGSGSSHSTTTAFGVSRKHRHLKFFPMDVKFTSEAEVDDYLSGDTIQCLECGIEKKSLGKHLPSHGLNVDSYKLKYGIPKGRAMITGALSEIRRQIAIRNNAELTAEEMQAKIAKMKTAPKRRPDLTATPDYIKAKHIAVGKANKGRRRTLRREEANCPECDSMCIVPINVKKRGNFLCQVCKKRHYRASQAKYAAENRERRLAMARASHAKRRAAKTMKTRQRDNL